MWAGDRPIIIFTSDDWNCPTDSMSPLPRVYCCLRWIARIPRVTARALITVYRHSISGLVGFHCRHLPTCSVYADEAIGRYGLWAGGWMTLARLCRCHPLGTSGLDLVPPAPPGGARWYLPWRYGRWRGTNHVIEPSHAPARQPFQPL